MGSGRPLAAPLRNFAPHWRRRAAALSLRR